MTNEAIHALLLMTIIVTGGFGILAWGIADSVQKNKARNRKFRRNRRK